MVHLLKLSALARFATEGEAPKTILSTVVHVLCDVYCGEDARIIEPPPGSSLGEEAAQCIKQKVLQGDPETLLKCIRIWLRWGPKQSDVLGKVVHELEAMDGEDPMAHFRSINLKPEDLHTVL